MKLEPPVTMGLGNKTTVQEGSRMKPNRTVLARHVHSFLSEDDIAEVAY
jgi:hypothetical protein